MTRGTDAEGGNHQQRRLAHDGFWCCKWANKSGKKPSLAPQGQESSAGHLLGAGPKGGKWAAMAPRADDEGRKDDSQQQNWQLAPKKCCRFLTVPFCRVEGNKERTAQETSWQRVLRTTFRPSSLLPSCCLLYSQPPIVVPLAAAD